MGLEHENNRQQDDLRLAQGHKAEVMKRIVEGRVFVMLHCARMSRSEQNTLATTSQPHKR
jgi:hypothetical protein